MSLIKTMRARDALKDRRSGLSLKQRQILILADGERGEDELLALLGADAARDLAALLQERYLISGDEVTALASDFGDSAEGEMWDISHLNPEQGAL